jgi:DNA-directed RNA polymerase specialized sigma24 family protein
MIQADRKIGITQGTPMSGWETQNKEQDCTWQSRFASKDEPGFGTGPWEVPCVERWADANDIKVNTPCINMHEPVNQWPAKLERPFRTRAQSPSSPSRGQLYPNEASQRSDRGEAFAPQQKLGADRTVSELLPSCQSNWGAYFPVHNGEMGTARQDNERVQRARAKIEVQDVPSLAKALTRYASGRMARWPRKRFGEEPADFAIEAIEDVYLGIRTWDPTTHPDLKAFLFDVVKSKVSNAAQKTAARNVSLEERLEDASPSHSDEAGLKDEMCKVLAHDQALVDVVDCYQNGFQKPADVAEELEISVEELRNRRRRIGRKCQDLLAEWTNAGVEQR